MTSPFCVSHIAAFAFSSKNQNRSACACFALIALACSALVEGQVQTHGAMGQTPAAVLNGNAALISHFDPAQKLRLAIVLTQPHMKEERQFLKDVQDKKSPQFHHFLSNEEWNIRFAPSAADEQAVVDWAQRNGFTVSQRFANRFLVDVEASSAVIEKALGVVMNNYQVGADTHFSNDRDPVLPASMSVIVDSVLGLNSLEHAVPKGGTGQYLPGRIYVAGAPRLDLGGSSRDTVPQAETNSAAVANVAAPSGGYWRPIDVFSSNIYNYGALMKQGHCCNPLNNPLNSPPEASIAIAAYGDVAFSDVAGFQAGFNYLSYNIQKYAIDGGYSCGASDPNCSEVTMDTEWSLATANSEGSSATTAKVYVYEGANSNLNTVADVMTFMVNDGYARVMSTSWGCGETTCFSASSMNTLDAIYSEMAGKGWTLVAASGDQGATADCGTALEVQYPASDPNVVGIGGTSLNGGSSASTYEVAWTGGTATGSCSQNNGGSTGGFSSYWKASSAPYQGSLGTYRAVPDMALDAATGHDVYFNGAWTTPGGTSVAGPMMAGFFAQENAYLLALGDKCGSGSSPCAPLGNANYPLYQRGFLDAEFKIPNPFYDTTSGCNSNDITAANKLTPFCAGTGFDEVTGWGSANMLQLAWALNDQLVPDDWGHPKIQFSGPSTAKWYNSDQTITWTVVDYTGTSHPGTGIAGFTQGWDYIVPASLSKPHGGTGDSFYNGPDYPNVSTGCLSLFSHGCGGGGLAQGCHVVHVQAWNNEGLASGDQTFGPICLDTLPPFTTGTLQGNFGGGAYVSPVTLSLSAYDYDSGVATTYYRINGGPNRPYTGPVTLSALGAYTIAFYSVDVAGNIEATRQTSFSIKTPTTTLVTSSLNPSSYGQTVTFTAKVVPSQALPAGTVPAGTVTFMNGAITLGTSALNNGVALLSFPVLQAGTSSILAIYSGDYYDMTSTAAALSQKVTKAPSKTTLYSSLNPAVYGTQVKLHAFINSANSGAVTGSVTGSVSFQDGATVLGTAPVNSNVNEAVFTVELSLGSHAITASYSGSVNDLPSKSSVLTETITRAASAVAIYSTNNPTSFGQPGDLVAAVTGSAGGTVSGTVTFQDGAATLGTVPVMLVIGTNSYLAAWDISSLAVGSHLITATYSGDAGNSSSASPVFTLVVNQAATTTALVASPSTAFPTQVVTLSASVTSVFGQPVTSGSVTFSDEDGILSTVPLTASNNAIFKTRFGVGIHQITASYNGTAGDLASTSAVVTEVIKGPNPPPCPPHSPPCEQ